MFIEQWHTQCLPPHPRFAITSTINVIRLANVPARIVFNAVPSRGDRADQARAAVEVFDVPCAPCAVGDRVAFMDAYTAGLTVAEYEPRGKLDELWGALPRTVRFPFLPLAPLFGDRSNALSSQAWVTL